MLLKRSFIGRNNKDGKFYGSNSYGSRVVFAGEGFWVCEVSIFLLEQSIIESVNLLSNKQNIFFFPRGLPFHSFIC